MGNLKDIWVFIEMSAQQPKRSSLEIFAKAQKIAAEAGAEAVPVLCPADGDFSAVEIAEAMKNAVEKETPGAVLFASTPLGKDISAILSADMNLGIASDCTDVMSRNEDLDLLFIRPTFDGKLRASVSLNKKPQIGSFVSGAFPMDGEAPDIHKNARLLKPENSTAIQRQFLEFIEDSGLAEVNIEEASILVAGGRGVGSAEGFEKLRELARLLGGNIAASRAAVDEGWISRDYQVGATGKTVAPKIYFACGISGAVPHVAGMKESDVIIAINTDASASIFDIAHYGIVGDLHQVIPELIAAIKAAKSE